MKAYESAICLISDYYFFDRASDYYFTNRMSDCYFRVSPIPFATLAFGISNKFFLKVPYLTIRQTQSTTFSFARKFNSRRARR
jgi:hypothetical protein